MAHQSSGPSGRDEDREVHERLVLPLLVPLGIFLFAVLVIYGLSRIYLELNDIKVGDVTMATPLALAVSLGILGVASYLATRPSVPRWQMASILLVTAALLTGGAVWAAVHDKGAAEEAPPARTKTPTGVAPGTIEVSLSEFEVAPSPDTTSAGPATFHVTNDGTAAHNLRVIKTGLAPGDLPVNDEEFTVDESRLDVVAKSAANIPAGQTLDVSVDNLEAGKYVLICNVPTHYESGMHTAFTVTEGGGRPAPTTPAAPGDTEAPPAGAGVTVSLVEFEVQPEPDSVDAGSITFTVTNDGSAIHNFRVIKTDLDSGDLPVDDETFAVNEDEVDVVAATERNLRAGETAEVTATLEAGSYVLICNVPTHYESRMHTAFTVQ